MENAGRSKMAEAFARHIGMNAKSAGTIPSSSVNSMVAQAMKERGIDLTDSRPVMLDDNLINWADMVIIMGCSLQDACPAPVLAAMQKKIVDWNIPDPKGKTMDEVRSIRDTIEKKVLQLAGEVAQINRKK